MLVLLDNGHGENTPGKRSPDGVFREYAYTRKITKMISAELSNRNIRSHILVPETEDISLQERCNRANALWESENHKAILLSIHVNAAGSDDKWHTATGWSAWTTKGITEADRFAKCLYEAADKAFSFMKIRNYSTGEYGRDWESDFYILKHSYCPAVLTENFFQDCKKDVEYLMSPVGDFEVVECHVKGIVKYLQEIGERL